MCGWAPLVELLVEAGAGISPRSKATTHSHNPAHLLSFWCHNNGNDNRHNKMILPRLEEEQKTLMLRLDRNINLCCDYMLRLRVAISCCNQMSIFQLDFPFLLLSISQNWNSAFTIAFFGVGFPVSAVKYFSKLGFCIYHSFFAFSLRGNIALMSTESLACDWRSS